MLLSQEISSNNCGSSLEQPYIVLFIQGTYNKEGKKSKKRHNKSVLIKNVTYEVALR